MKENNFSFDHDSELAADYLDDLSDNLLSYVDDTQVNDSDDDTAEDNKKSAVKKKIHEKINHATTALDAYFSKISNYQRLNPEQEKILVKKINNAMISKITIMSAFNKTINWINKLRDQIITTGSISRIISINNFNNSNNINDFDLEFDKEVKTPKSNDIEIVNQILEIIDNINNLHITLRTKLSKIKKTNDNLEAIIDDITNDPLLKDIAELIMRLQISTDQTNKLIDETFELEEELIIKIAEIDRIRKNKKRKNEALCQRISEIEEIFGFKSNIVLALIKKVREYDQEQINGQIEMLATNLKLAVSIARKHSIKGGLTQMDLILEAISGLIKGIQKFEPRSNKVSTYVCCWSHQAAGRCLTTYSSIVRTPVHINDFYNRISKVIRVLSNSLRRQPTYEEIAEYLGESPDKIINTLRLCNEVVMIDKVREEGEVNMLDFVTYGDMPAHLTKSIKKENAKQLAQALADSDPTTENIVRSRSGLGLGRISGLIQQNNTEDNQKINMKTVILQHLQKKKLLKYSTEDIIKWFELYQKGLHNIKSKPVEIGAKIKRKDIGVVMQSDIDNYNYLESISMLKHSIKDLRLLYYYLTNDGQNLEELDSSIGFNLIKGLDKSATLQGLGERFAVTREAIRQKVHRFCNRMKGKINMRSSVLFPEDYQMLVSQIF